MRSKKFAGELCVYCNSRPAVVPDHVFARKFFLLNKRGNLPQVPACDQCNNEKSRLTATYTISKIEPRSVTERIDRLRSAHWPIHGRNS